MKLKGIAFDDTKWTVDEARREMKKLEEQSEKIINCIINL